MSEAGGHRWQRIPPTEKRGRVHTSTVTVAVLPLVTDAPKLNLRDVSIETKRGSGAGGQHRNKTESAVRAVHLPTGLVADICCDRSQHRNKEIALMVLAQRVATQNHQRNHDRRDQRRRDQIGSGMRADKIRTYRERDNQVVDHRSGKKGRLDQAMKGVLPL